MAFHNVKAFDATQMSGRSVAITARQWVHSFIINPQPFSGYIVLLVTRRLYALICFWFVINSLGAGDNNSQQGDYINSELLTSVKATVMYCCDLLTPNSGIERG
jgi:hypothetical protein